MLREALHYRSLGLSVIPLRSGGKEPMPKWKEFQSRIASEAEVKEWFLKWPDANIGIVTGKVSAIVVVDLDGLEGIAKGRELRFESSVKTITGGGGHHLWFRYQEGVKSQTLWTGPNPHQEVAIKSDLKYVVAPPSIHESGRRYRWLCPFVGSAKLPSLPVGMLSVSPVSTNVLKTSLG